MVDYDSILDKFIDHMSSITHRHGLPYKVMTSEGIVMDIADYVRKLWADNDFSAIIDTYERCPCGDYSILVFHVEEEVFTYWVDMCERIDLRPEED